MNTSDFTSLTINPKAVSTAEIIALESVMKAFPYFQTARVLHLKGLKNERNFQYNTTLKKVAAYTNNREVLFDFITEDVLNFEEESTNQINLLQDIEVVDSKLVEHLYESITAAGKKNETEGNPEILEIGKPIEFDKNDSFSFNEWLQLAPKKPIVRGKSNEKSVKPAEKSIEKENKIAKKMELFESFVSKKPRIKADKNQSIIDVSEESTTENSSLMTETLARVYVEQKKYDKAITAFKILSLKYPKKSSFFADRIQAIKNIQKQ